MCASIVSVRESEQQPLLGRIATVGDVLLKASPVSEQQPLLGRIATLC